MSLADICPTAERKASGSEISVRSGGKQYAFASIGDIAEARGELLARNRQILDAAEDGGRGPERQEKREMDQNDQDERALTLAMKEAEGGSRQSLPFALEGAGGRSSLTGDRGEVLTREQSVSDWVSTRSRGADFGGDFDLEETRGFSLGRMVRGMVSGQWDGAELERRAMAEGTDATGGYLTPEVLSGRIIDRIRSQAHVLQAGAQTVPLESDTQSIPRMKAGVEASWKKENEPVAEDAPEFERVTFKPKTLPVLVKLSQELFEDMLPGSAASIEGEITKALALELDRVALRGTGTDPEPKGILNQTGVTVSQFNTTPTDYKVLTEGVGTLMEANVEPNGAIYAARTAKKLGTLADTTGQPLRRPSLLENVTEYSSNQVPTNLEVGGVANTSEVYIADWTQLMFGVRPTIGVRVRVLDQAFADHLQIGIIAWLRADVQLEHPEAFYVATKVKP